MAKLALHSLLTQFERDVPIWDNKTFVRRPWLVKQDGPIGRYRRWFSRNFYSENSGKCASRGRTRLVARSEEVERPLTAKGAQRPDRQKNPSREGCGRSEPGAPTPSCAVEKKTVTKVGAFFVFMVLFWLRAKHPVRRKKKDIPISLDAGPFGLLTTRSRLTANLGVG